MMKPRVQYQTPKQMVDRIIIIINIIVINNIIKKKSYTENRRLVEVKDSNLVGYSSQSQ